MGMDTISPVEAVSYIGENGVLFVDMRGSAEYREGHIPGAVRMSYEELLRRKTELAKKRMIILYCDRGNASLLAARGLRDLPVEIRSIAYGMSGYQGPIQRSGR